MPEISHLLEDMGIGIAHAEQLEAVIERSIRDPGEKSQERRQANQIMFDALDGQAGKRAVMALKDKFPDCVSLFARD